MEKSNSAKKEFQTSLITYLHSKSVKKTILNETKQTKQPPKMNKPDENHKLIQKDKDPHVTNKQQQQSIQNRSLTDQLSSISVKSSSPQLIIYKKQSCKNINVLFYLNKLPSQPNGEYVDKMHENWFRNYEKLERDHSFIQWIFPNSFQSRFNIYARPLSQIEAEQFRTNPQIISRYLKSYEMMLGFYGLKLKDRSTGELMRSRDPDFKQRMYKTLLTSFHNHMRITRICCSLTQTGFGRFAAQLCKILKFEIYNKQGFMNSLQRYNVYKDWAPFEIYDEKKGLGSVYFLKINRKKQQNYQINSCKGQPSKQKNQKSLVQKQEEICTIKALLNKGSKE